MKTLFQIDHTEPRSGEDTLLCEWGERYCCYTIYNHDSRSIAALRYIVFDEPASLEEIDEVLRLQHSNAPRFSKVIFCSGFPQAVLVPKAFFSEDPSPIALLTEGKRMRYFHDLIGEWQVINNYAFPKIIYQKGVDAFGNLQMSHVYTTTLKTYNGYTADAQVSVDFSPRNFRVVVKRQGQIQLAQMYEYTAPLDVVYFLLRIYQELHLSKEETHIILSGLIDEASALYKELHSYFLNLHFVHPTGLSLTNKEYPPHFFASIYNLVQCVS